MLPVACMALLDKIQSVMSGQIQAIRSPFTAFNRSFGGGFREGEVSILAGGPGSGKSHFIYQHIIHCFENGFKCSYMPLEDEKVDHLQRISAHLVNDWKLLTADADEMTVAADRLDEATLKKVAEISKSVSENPAFQMVDNKLFDVTARFVLDWIVQQGNDGSRLIIVDPVSNINFSEQYKKENDVQKRFMHELIARVKKIPSHVILVCHLGKGENGSAGNVAGSAAFTRNAHNDLRIMHHPTMQSRVVRGIDEPKEWHNRTMYIAKARNGLPHTAIAFNVGNSCPTMQEVGIILPQEEKKYVRR